VRTDDDDDGVALVVSRPRSACASFTVITVRDGGYTQLLDVAYNRTEQRDRERERKQHTNLLPSTHWLFSFLVSVERQISCARRPAARWWKGAKGLLIIITRQSNNNGEDFVFSFNSHIFKREKEEKKKNKTKQKSQDSRMIIRRVVGIPAAFPLYICV
jgi:hypothetical protein